jgi:hypothetical protein
MKIITKFIGGAADGTEATSKGLGEMPAVLKLTCDQTGQELEYRLASNMPEVRVELVYRYELTKGPHDG